ncbi:hypothetical protein G4Y79_03370 [Phototrophicus methaneseepsis]|uniref:Glycoside hydrolase family 5 domain-containing protein n=1 Tax=Phototrophicus methaneseepsis TaxID=2710758 RepID=A0A7S8EAL5_9CHLR|nr:hypothetical protein [Phototrophicus methaneseepsis]QPC83436.1 hypothetical protein G4Y79_03370 [Phototrophicus methaneseepsis]
MNNPQTPGRTTQWRRIIIGIVAVIIILAALLALDLANHGLIWRILWSQTGEEQPVGQIQGAIELGANLLRVPPQTAPQTPIQHTDDIPYGINTFFQNEVETDKMRVMMAMIREAGFVWLRQEFPWEDLEVDGRGQFTDTRNDTNGDGEINADDTVDAWAKYDQIVDLAEEYGLRLKVRLSNPPAWAHADSENTTPQAPPDDVQDFVNYAVAVAERYQGRIQHYQIWNEPNIYPEWGEAFADPVAYTDMLCRTYEALKAVDPEIVVITAAIAPTISLDGYYGYQDVIYLENMYSAGAGTCFDVLAAQGYGLRSGPTDRRLGLTQVNYQRHLYYRDIMVAHGDADKPIWLSEVGWNAILDADLPPEQIIQYGQFGLNTQDEVARWSPLAYQRAAEEWPWIGQISFWFFTLQDPFTANQASYYFRMVEPDYSPEDPTFTPLPVYETMKAYITERMAAPVLYQGVHQAESWEIETHTDIEASSEDTAGTLLEVADAQFGTAIEAYEVAFSAYGTQVQMRIQVPLEDVLVYVDGAQVRSVESQDNWRTVILSQNVLPREHHYRLVAMREDFLLDSILVENNAFWNILPFVITAFGILLTIGAFIYWWWQLHRRR